MDVIEPLTPNPAETPDTSVSDARVRRVLQVDSAVVEAIDRHVGANTGVEQGGVLVGTVDPGGGSVAITASIPAEHSLATASSLTFTHESWVYMNDTLERDHPGLSIVGWYHSHPGFGIFLSEYDTFIQANFFSASFHVAYVVDPLLDDRGFFGWEDGRIVRYPEWDLRMSNAQAKVPTSVPSTRSIEAPKLTRSSRALMLGVVIGAVIMLVATMLLNGGSEAPSFPRAAVSHDLAPQVSASQTWTFDEATGCLRVGIEVVNNSPSELLMPLELVLPLKFQGPACSDEAQPTNHRFLELRGPLRPGERASTTYTVLLDRATVPSPDDVDLWLSSISLPIPLVSPGPLATTPSISASVTSTGQEQFLSTQAPGLRGPKP